MAALIVAFGICLAAPAALWWYGPPWASWIPWLGVLYLAGAWWMSRSHERWTGTLREVAARYVVACVYTVLAIFALPISLLVGLGRLLAWITALPIVMFGAHGLQTLAARRGWVPAGELFEGTTYWILFGGLAVTLGLALHLGLRFADRFDGQVKTAVAEAASGLSGLLAARFGVALRG